jgi:hypothetical protein
MTEATHPRPRRRAAALRRPGSLGNIDTGAALHCLQARALLCDAGAQPVPLAPPRTVDSPPSPGTIREALAELAHLAPVAFAARPVLAAAHACQQALHAQLSPDRTMATSARDLLEELTSAPDHRQRPRLDQGR